MVIFLAGKISGQRTISSIIIVILALATILPGGAPLAVILYLLSNIAFIELTRACGIHRENGKNSQKKICDLEIIGMLGILAYYLVIYFGETSTYFMVTVILFLVALMFVYVFTFPKYHASEIMTTYFSFVYAPIMLSFVYLTRQLPDGVYLVWMIFIGSWISDTAAYVVGVLFGKHKLAPVLSPKKSIEGSIGGIAGSALVSAFYGFILMEKLQYGSEFIVVMAVIGAAGSVISQVGDLAASAIKRNHEIKDYGHLIPGHGGVMDRFDSVIVTAPMVYFLATILLG